MAACSGGLSTAVVPSYSFLPGATFFSPSSALSSMASPLSLTKSTKAPSPGITMASCFSSTKSLQANS